MADFNALETLINAYIKQNGVQAITGQVLNGVLRGMVSALGKGWTIAGAAEPNTDPGTMTGPVAYIAHTAGTYTDFGGLVVNDGEVAFLKYNEQTWTKEVLASLAATASVDGNVGTPSVTTQFVNGVLNFAFHNIKGDPGVDGTDGDAAGFGTVAATVDNTIGTPAVSVSASGPDTAKNFTFAFTGLKGATGVTSAVVTVDNTSGTPQCAVSLVGQELHLDFTGLKGAQGDTGSSVAYPFTIVNNVTTNDATQALSAAMGVQLESEISQLELKVTDFEDAVLDQIENYKPIVIEGDVENAPDEEDITTDENNLLKFANRSALYGLGYVILRRGETFASQINTANTIYEIRYNFDLNNSQVTIPSGCVLKFVGGTLSNGSLALQGTKIDGTPSFSSLTLTGTIKNETICSKWFDSLDRFILSCNYVSGYSVIDVQKGNYNATNGFVIPRSVKINFNDSTINVSPDVAAFITIGDSTSGTTLTHLSSAASKGDNIITVSDADGISSGDILILQDSTNYSYNSYRNYHEGEFLQVDKVSGNTIYLVRPLCGNYVVANLANCAIIKHELYTCSVSDVNLVMNKTEETTERFFVRGYYLVDSKISGITGKGCDVNIVLECCYNSEVERCIFDSHSDTLDQYGVAISNSQYINVSQIRGVCGNHIVCIVGSFIVSRFVNFIDCSGKSGKSSYNGMNVHGSGEYILFERCESNGIELGGDYITLKDCTISKGANDRSVSLGEITGYNITIDGCNLYGIFYNTTTGLSGVNRTDNNQKFVLRNCVWEQDSESDICRKSSFSNTVYFTIENSIIRGGDINISCPSFYFTIRGCKIENYLFYIRKLVEFKFEYNTIVNGASGRTILTYNSGTAANLVSIVGNSLKSSSAQKDINFTYMGGPVSIFRFENNYLEKPSGSGYVVDSGGSSVFATTAIVANNTFYIMGNYAKFRATTFYDGNNILWGTAGHILLETS